MTEVRFARHIERHVPCPPMSVAATTVRGALDEYFSAHPAVRTYVLDDQQRVRKHVVVFLNDVQLVDRVGLTDTVGPSDTIHVLQALSGG
jgi:molybdopterin synthase sulfur carrier subunit